MGSVRTLSGRGTLFMDFRYLGKRCREYTALDDTPANRKRLEKALTKLEADIAAGTFDYASTFPNSRHDPASKMASPSGEAPQPSTPVATAAAVMASPGTPTFRDFTTQWLAEHRVEWRRSHIKVLTSTIEGHLLPTFGDKSVGSITKSDIFALRAKLADLPGRAQAKMSNKRINGILAPLRQILNEAAERHGFVSPTTTLKPLRIRKTDVAPFTLDEVQRILSATRPDFRDYFTVRVFTGMRTGEAHGLKWKYVDFENRLVLIRETYVLGEDEYTKTDSSQRAIHMTPVVYEALKRQFEATRQAQRVRLLQPRKTAAGQQELLGSCLVPAAAAPRPGSPTPVPVATYRSHALARVRRGARMDRAAARPQQHRDAVSGLQPLRAQPDAAGWLGHRSAAGHTLRQRQRRRRVCRSHR